MNMKSLFLGDKKIIDLVYAPNVCSALSEKADLNPNCVISSNDPVSYTHLTLPTT